MAKQPVLGEAEAEGGEKALDLSRIIQRSVQQPADGAGMPAGSGDNFVLWMAGQAADGMTEWGRLPKKRDRELRNFWPTENYLAGAMGSVVARNATFDWKLTGGEATAKAVKRILSLVHYGRGWQHLWAKESLDLYSQDSGAFLQFIREEDDPDAPIMDITHLDAWRMFPTGVPEEPYVYYDRKGRYHRMKWYQVYNLMELPSPVEHGQGGVFYELQYCAVTRLLRAAQILRNVAIYKDEKTAGRFLRAVHILGGVSQEAVQDAIKQQSLMADQAGLIKYMQPLMMSSLDPNAKASVATLELATLPDGWDEEKTMKGYVMALSLGFLTDYQEFAPLPGGGLGTSQQSEILHAKSRGKGPALFKKLVAHVLNEFVLPENVEFEWDEQDLDAEEQQATITQLRVQTRAAQITSGEIDSEAALQMAVEAGDVPEELAPEIEQRREQRRADEEARLSEQAAAMNAQGPGVNKPPGNGTAGAPGANKPAGNVNPGGAGNPPPAGKALIDGLVETLTADVKDENWRVTLGEFLQSRIHRAFTVAADDLYGLGYMDTDGRILLSSLIGDALEHFAESMDAQAAAYAVRLIEDEDVRQLIKAIGDLGAAGRKDSLDNLPPSRRKMERAATDKYTEALDAGFTRVIERMRFLNGDEDAKDYAPAPAKKKPRRTRQTQKVKRDAQGRIEAVETRTEEQ